MYYIYIIMYKYIFISSSKIGSGICMEILRHLGMFSSSWKQEFAKRSNILDSFEIKDSRIIIGQIES